MYTNFSISSTLSQKDLFLAAKGKRLPAVLPYNGVAVGADLVVRQGQENKSLFAGALNYWFLRDWASWSLGQDCPEVVEALPGARPSFRVFYPELDKTIPPAVTLTGDSFDARPWTFVPVAHQPGSSPPLIGLGGVMAVGKHLDQEMFVTAPGCDEIWPVGSTRYYSPYKFFATHAYFDSPIKGFVDKMPLLDFPPVPFEVARGRIVYRRSPLEDVDEGYEQALFSSGYMFRVDEEENFIYYTNSVACFYGLPPVAEALGWSKLQLDPLPSDWLTRAADSGIMPFGRCGLPTR
jgi:hypothetical protein